MSRDVARRSRFALLLGCLVALVAGPALADTAPVDPTDPRTPVTVSADALPTVQIDGVVWQQIVVGGTVYAAGKFATARPAGAAPGVGTVARANLLAYDLATGELRSGFVANLNAQAKALAASPDGRRLYVGGDFTTVNGTPRQRIAALDPVTGAVDTSFTASANAQVKAIAATASTVYLGGVFSTLGSTARANLGAVDAATGATVRPGFAPAVNGAVLALALAPVGHAPRLVLGGAFTTVNGSGNPGYGLGAVDPTTGASLPFKANATVRNAGANAAIYSLASDATTVYGSGYVFGAGGNLEGAFAANWSDTELKWLEDCHGDTYSVAPSDNALYTAGHPHQCENIGGFPETTPRTNHRAVAFSRAATGTVRANNTGNYVSFAGKPAPSLLTWFPEVNAGTYTGQAQGAWSVAASGPYVVYGGEFTKVNGQPQQGLVRFATSEIAPDVQGPRATGADSRPVARTTAPGTVVVEWPSNWDRDNASLTYTVYQDSTAVATVTAMSSFWSRPWLSHTITGVPAGAHTYRVVAADPLGNKLGTDRVSPSTPSVPTTTTKSPAPKATGVAVGTATSRTKLTVGFSEAVTGVSSSTFRLRRGTTDVLAAVTYDATTRVATLTPAAPLAPDSSYTLALRSGIRSASGGQLAPQEWGFVTGPLPTVTSRTPASGATSVSRTGNIRATLSEPVTGIPTTAASTGTVTLKQTSTGRVFTARASYAATSRVVTLDPSGTLAARTKYTVTLTSGIKDRAGNPLKTLSWTFTTRS